MRLTSSRSARRAGDELGDGLHILRLVRSVQLERDLPVSSVVEEGGRQLLSTLAAHAFVARLPILPLALDATIKDLVACLRVCVVCGVSYVVNQST